MTRRSCVSPDLDAVEGSYLTTIEAVEAAKRAPYSRMEAIDVPQCGCVNPDRSLSATALLREIPNPTGRDIDNAMARAISAAGATYVRIRAAIKTPAKAAGG